MKRVYFIKPIVMDGPVKIGCSANPGKRARSLETWSPFPLEVVASIEGDNITEGRFHRAFLATHQHGEWFRWSAELQSVIDAIKADTFDVDSLPPYAGVLKGMEDRLKSMTALDEEYMLVRRQFLNLPWRTIQDNGGIPTDCWLGLKSTDERKRELIDRMAPTLEKCRLEKAA